MDGLTAMFVLLTTSAWLLFVLPQQATAGYSVGVGIADVTGPSAEVGFVSTPRCWFSFMSVLNPGCTCLPPITRAVASSVQDLVARSGVAGCLSLGQQFTVFETPCCRPFHSPTVPTVGLPDLKMAALGTVERWGTSVRATERHITEERSLREQFLLVGSELHCRHSIL
jgi:hypothetical protein